MKRLILALMLFGVLVCYNSSAQSEGGRLAFGFSGGATKYWGEFTDNQFWLQGQGFFRYNILSNLSLQATFGLSQIRFKTDTKARNSYPEYFLSDTLLQPKNSDAILTYELTLSYNFFPSQSFVPHLFAGVGFMTFEPKIGEAGSFGAAPNNSKGTYKKSNLEFPLGLGFETYLTDDLVLNGNVTYRLLGTDYIDDLADGDYGTDSSDYSKYAGSKGNDKLLTFGIGLTYYILGETDYDGDGLTNDRERELGTDPHNPDTDNDGLFDGMEIKQYKTDPANADTDNDGLNDGPEVNDYGTNPTVMDSDGDNINDGDEVRKYKTNPVADDTDSDGLKDGEEILTFKTDPLEVDCDKDGLKDGDEVLVYKTNPTLTDTDGDMLNDGDEVLKYKTNPLVVDTDNDKLSDGDEVNRVKTDPTNPDTDGDTVIDGEDDCPLVAGEPNTIKGKNGCPQPPKIGTKTDFPDILFIVNTDKFNFDYVATALNLAKLLEYVKQCEGLQVAIEGHASEEGNKKRNQELSELRAKKVVEWLLSQGVKSSAMSGAVGYGSSQPKVKEPTGKALKKMSKDDLENIRRSNRRITVKITKTCD